MNQIVRAELQRHDWGGLRCGCGGTAEHVPATFRALVEAVEPADAFDASLDGHLEIEGNLFEVAVPAVGVILAALGGELAPFARSSLLTTLWRLVTGDAHHLETARGVTDLGDRCRSAAREGMWTIINGLDPVVGMAFDVMPRRRN